MNTNVILVSAYWNLLKRSINRNSILFFLIGSVVVALFFVPWGLVVCSAVVVVWLPMTYSSRRSRWIRFNRGLVLAEIADLSAMRQEMKAATDFAWSRIGNIFHVTTGRHAAAFSEAERIVTVIDARLKSLSRLSISNSLKVLEAAQLIAHMDLVLKADCLNSYIFAKHADFTIRRADLPEMVRRTGMEIRNAVEDLQQWQPQLS